MATLPLQAETAQAVLARMDAEAASFRQLSAKLKKSSYIAVLDDTSQESGTMWMKRAGRSMQMRVEITEPEPRSIGLQDSQAQMYYPKIQTVQIYDIGKNRSMVDQFLLLGFGSSGRDLQKGYEVKLGGQEVVGGRPASRLELTPKSQRVQEQIRKVELWIPTDAGHPIQQKFLQPGGDYYLVTYSEINLNPGLPDENFRLNLPAGVKREYPQK